MSHLSNPQAQRTLRFLTGVACVGVGLQSVFFSKFEEVEGFEGKEHIFTHIQKDAREFIDRNIYGIDPDVVKQARAKKRHAGNNNNNDTDNDTDSSNSNSF